MDTPPFGDWHFSPQIQQEKSQNSLSWLSSSWKTRLILASVWFLSLVSLFCEIVATPPSVLQSQISFQLCFSLHSNIFSGKYLTVFIAVAFIRKKFSRKVSIKFHGPNGCNFPARTVKFSTWDDLLGTVVLTLNSGLLGATQLIPFGLVWKLGYADLILQDNYVCTSRCGWPWQPNAWPVRTDNYVCTWPWLPGTDNCLYLQVSDWWPST